MGLPSTSPEERFTSLVDEFIGSPGVTPPQDGTRSGQRFGAAGLKIHDKIFAMLVRGRLVVKLPKSRVDELVASGDGDRYDPRRDGRLMKEWLVLEPASQLEWLPLAREAMEFVGAKH